MMERMDDQTYAAALDRFVEMERAFRISDWITYNTHRTHLMKMRHKLNTAEIAESDLRDMFEQASAEDPREAEADPCAAVRDVMQLTPAQMRVRDFLSPHTPYRSLLLAHGVGVGKCHARDTPLIMADGSLKMVQDVCVGDLLMGDDGTARRVLSLARGWSDAMYEILPESSDFDAYVVNDEHILCVTKDSTAEVHEVTVKQLLDNMHNYRCVRAVVPGFVKEPHVECQEDTDWFSAIPQCHLTSDKEARVRTFRSFLDTCRSRLRNGEAQAVRHRLAMPDALFLARSLGLAVSVDASGVLAATPSLTSRFTVRRAESARYYGFTLDGNCRYLLGDFTVTHNTCTAITAIERLRDVHAAAFQKSPDADTRPLVLLPAHLKPTFSRQLLDVARLDFGKDGRLASDTVPPQCVGSRYLQMVPDRRRLNREDLQHKVDSVISKFYQVFSFMEFANYVERMEQRIARVQPDPDKHDIMLLVQLRNTFNGRVIVIDEVHNLRSGSGNVDLKKVPPKIKKLITAVENSKLILMSATPMFNKASEIVFIANLMLSNEKRSVLSEDDIFDPDGSMSTHGKRLLMAALRGRVSYVEGQDPRSFPARLYPVNDPQLMVSGQVPKQDLTGARLPREHRLDIEKYPLIVSTMKGQSKQQYTQFIDMSLDKFVAEDALVMDDFDEESPGQSDMHNGLQLSIVAFPQAANKQTLSIGNAGFRECFRTYTQNGHVRFAYAPDVPHFMAPPLVHEHCPKIATIVDRIMSSTGVVLVYSAYMLAGVSLLAIALEHRGFQRYGGNNLLQSSSGSSRLSYVLLTGDKTVSSTHQEFSVAASPANADGSVIKVILGTRKASEGLDMKFVREVHVLDPWYHMNRIEQVIGRASRRCSHAALPELERNTTIYLHVAAIPGEDRESIDMRVFRIAQQKQAAINEVLAVMKTASLEHVMGIDRDVRTKRTLQVSSQGQHVKVVLPYTVVPFKRLQAIHDQRGHQVQYVLDNLDTAFRQPGTYHSIDAVADTLGLDPAAVAYSLLYILTYYPVSQHRVRRAGNYFCRRTAPHSSVGRSVSLADIRLREDTGETHEEAFHRIITHGVSGIFRRMESLVTMPVDVVMDMLTDRMMSVDLQHCAAFALLRASTVSNASAAVDSMKRGGMLYEHDGTHYMYDAYEDILKEFDAAAGDFGVLDPIHAHGWDAFQAHIAHKTTLSYESAAAAMVLSARHGVILRYFLEAGAKDCSAASKTELLLLVKSLGTGAVASKKDLLCEQVEALLRMQGRVMRTVFFLRLKRR